jgi:hypothetical protein
MFALAVLAVGMRLALVRYKRSDVERARHEAWFFSPKRLWLFYLVSLALSVLILSVAWVFPGITQLALGLASMKWAVYFMFVYSVFLRSKGFALLLAAFAIELAFGFGEYFSSFRTVFFVTILALVASGKRFSGKQITLVLTLTSVLFAVSLAWTSIKTEYRDYLSGGQRAQIVTRGYVERIQKLFDMVSELEKEDMGDALQDMADRISYVDFFGRALITVPSRVPHEDGGMWGGALRHIFMPRLLFPDKPVLLNDSEITGHYTGLRFGGASEGTTVSIGYVAESYIDFGAYWMFIPILGLGFLWGTIYRFFLSRGKTSQLMGYGLAVVVLLGALTFEITFTKLLGGVITSFLVAFVVQKFIVKKLVRKLMVKSSQQSNKTSFMPRQV